MKIRSVRFRDLANYCKAMPKEGNKKQRLAELRIELKEVRKELHDLDRFVQRKELLESYAIRLISFISEVENRRE